MTEEELFLEALSRPVGRDRSEFLRYACRDDVALRRNVEMLLAAHDSPTPLDRIPNELSESFSLHDLDNLVTATNSAAGGRAASCEPLLAGTLLAGRYRLESMIGEGGMGTVFRAEQIQPVRRQVAVKLIRRGMDSGRVMMRFDAERQALAVMDHPGIAKIFDAGTTDEGQPFFVMEHVSGLPLHEYCDRHRLPIAERLRLFIAVCQAVQHAHQKAVIHRDLKPSNVLVAPVDGRPMPKIIDFGLAKALSAGLLPDVSLELSNPVLGTPLYMAPEQADPGCRDIDTRADVYSLGVMLYELLSGSTPLIPDTVRRRDVPGVFKMIREEPPPPPSQRLISSEEFAEIAERRSTDPERLRRLVRGDLDWIAMTCLEKDRNRRYETANTLANDLLRHLAHEPVMAGPPSRWYAARKFVRRHRGAVASTAVIGLVLLGGFIGTWLGWTEARAQERHARKAADAEREAKDQARAQLVLLAKDYELFTSIFDDLDVNTIAGANEPLQTTLARRLVEAAKHFEGETAGDPLIIAGLRVRLGGSLKELGYPSDAIPLIEKACATYVATLGPDDDQTLEAQDRLADAYQKDLRFRKAMDLFAEIHRRRHAALGPFDPRTLRSQHHYADSVLNVGWIPKALPLLEETLDLMRTHLGTDNLDTVRCMADTAACYRYAKLYDKALPLLIETLDRRKALLPPDHPETLNSQHHLGAGYELTGQLAKALPHFELAFLKRKAILGTEHTFTLASQERYAHLLLLNGQQTKGLEEFERYVTTQRQLYPFRKGINYRDLLMRVAVQIIDAGSVLAAEPFLLENEKLHLDSSPPIWRSAYIQSQIGWLRLHQKREAEAEALMLSAYRDMMNRVSGNVAAGKASNRRVAEQIVRMYQMLNRPDEVRKWQAELAKHAAPDIE